ncbi:hypothetical protein [Methylobacter sp. BlB1]|jgi:hypothetical protein|uniref:hypothetical protein n=1 Tax=Methylobacter sp. BlB1 TaxID=2785914 RepID=UPI001895CA87|nr:hypothetical protein [Methylobacter sp. BlB1]MBF6649130.1 hypothetical protein [Methylobacter sp. BlB1]
MPLFLRTHSRDNDEHEMPGLTSWQGAEKIRTSMRVLSTRCATRDLYGYVPFLSQWVSGGLASKIDDRLSWSLRKFNVENISIPSFSSTETTGRLEISHCSASIKMANWKDIFSVYVF